MPDDRRWVVVWQTLGSREWIATPPNTRPIAEAIAARTERLGFPVLGVRLATAEEVANA